MPAFVACCARSGSTLLRLLLDAHAGLSCPGETDLAVLVHQHVAIATGPLRPPVGGPGTPGGSEERAGALDAARGVAETLMEGYLARTGKTDWCDKSLSNVFHLDLLADIWPGARFVLLHRHCMDMVLSGLEASPWGLSAYGFEPVAQRSPTDSVVALAAYWADRTARMLDFERRQGARCLRLRYEDLVAAPVLALGRVWEHLGLEPPGDGAGELAGRLDAPGVAVGPADHTIWYTDRVHAEAVGRGARVPPDHVVGPLRAQVNELLEALGYGLVDEAWGSGGPGPAGPGPLEHAALELRVVAGHEVLERRAVPLAADDPAAGAVVAVEAEALGGLASGRWNLGAALRSRHARYYGPPLGDFAGERRALSALRAYLAEHGGTLAGIGATRRS